MINHCVKIYSHHELNQWDNFLKRQTTATIYHTSNWLELIREVYHYQLLNFVLEDRTGKIVGGLPFFWIKNKITRSRLTAVPAAQYCNPIVENELDLNLLLDFLVSFVARHKIEYFEIRLNESMKINQEKVNDQYSHYSCYKLDLKQPVDELFKTFHKSCIQRSIKKGERNNLEFVRGNSEEDIKTFYRLFVRMRKRYGLLPQPVKFFVKMWERLSPNGFIEVLHVKYRKEVISSMILTKFNDTVIYEYGATNPDFIHLSPSPFLLWEAIKQSHHQGYQYFDFGRTENNHKGLSDFKERWNAKKDQLTYCYYPSFSGFANLRQKSTLKKSMNFSMKYAPLSVCQLAGQLLYRNFI